MIDNILEYLITDVYYQLWMVAHAANPTRNVFTREDWDENLVAQFPDPSIIPDYIGMEPGGNCHMNEAGRFHLGRNEPSLSFSEMTIAWGKVSSYSEGSRIKLDIDRKVGPAKIVITNLHKWHHDGVLHRRRGDAVIVKNATFTWGRGGKYGRDTGPYHISLKTIRAKAHMGQVSDFRHSNISTSWSTSSGRRLSGLQVKNVIADNNIEVNLLATDSVFEDATDEVIFLTEIAE